MEDLVQKPILFNYWKHHMNFLLADIQKQYAENDITSLKTRIKKIGNSTTDLYTGNLDIPELVSYCMAGLKKIHRYRKDTYLNWLRQSPEEYQLMDFPDGSVWILKIGTEVGRYIHLHPGRNVPQTMRVKATILKTTYIVNLYALKEKISPLDINLINTIRNDILGLSPIKFVTLNQDLGKMIYLFGSNLGIFK
jgi:hypothetical protein